MKKVIHCELLYLSECQVIDSPQILKTVKKAALFVIKLFGVFTKEVKKSFADTVQALFIATRYQLVSLKESSKSCSVKGYPDLFKKVVTKGTRTYF